MGAQWTLEMRPYLDGHPSVRDDSTTKQDYTNNEHVKSCILRSSFAKFRTVLIWILCYFVRSFCWFVFQKPGYRIFLYLIYYSPLRSYKSFLFQMFFRWIPCLGDFVHFCFLCCKDGALNLQLHSVNLQVSPTRSRLQSRKNKELNCYFESSQNSDSIISYPFFDPVTLSHSGKLGYSSWCFPLRRRGVVRYCDSRVLFKCTSLKKPATCW